MAFDGDLQEAALQKLRSDEQGIAIDVRLSAGVREVATEEVRPFLIEYVYEGGSGINN